MIDLLDASVTRTLYDPPVRLSEFLDFGLGTTCLCVKTGLNSAELQLILIAELIGVRTEASVFGGDLSF